MTLECFSLAAWVLLILIEEGFALAQRTKGASPVVILSYYGGIIGHVVARDTFSLAAAQCIDLIPYISQFKHGLDSLHCLFSESFSQNEGSPPQNLNECGTWVRNINGGVFTSPNYPNTYPPNKECVYILEGTCLFLPAQTKMASAVP